MVGAALSGLGMAVPQARSQEELWTEFFSEHYAGNAVAEKLWRRSGIETRHGVADPLIDDVRALGTEARMQRFMEAAMPLGHDAILSCLDEAGLEPSDVGLLTVVSCTGYSTPGLDILLARDLGMSDAVQRLHVGHMGCYAAVPGLATINDAAVARGKVAVMLCLELTSLHVQPPDEEIEQMVAHALFSDAAAAVAVVPEGPGLEIVDLVARTDAANAALMTWEVTDHGFRMGLSPLIPEVLERHVVGVMDELLTRHGVEVHEVAGWAVHPGGPRILNVIEERLELDPGALAESHATLRDYGNCSSATVILVLQRILAERDLADGDHVVFMAFGPGLTLYAALLRKRGG